MFKEKCRTFAACKIFKLARQKRVLNGLVKRSYCKLGRNTNGKTHKHNIINFFISPYSTVI